MTFRDRLLTRAGAHAITSPGAILGGGLGAAVGIAAGAPLVAAAAVAAAVYAGVAYAQLPRAPEREVIDPATLRPPWQTFVEEAIDARDRFDQAVANTPSGPMQERLQAIADRVADGVHESYRVARHGEALEDALGQLEPLKQVESRLAGVEQERADGREDDQRLASMAASLKSQIASTRRIGEVARDTRDRLRLLDARLDESVARAVELSLRSGDVGDVGGLGTDVNQIVGEMESLRVALEEAAAL